MAGPIRTQFAMKAIDLADLFKVVVGAQPLEASEGPSFAVELQAPDGPSTGGGAQSVQHIRLVRDGLTLVAGSIDPVEKTAELRSYDHIAMLYDQRYRGQPLPLSREGYDATLKRMRAFLGTQNLSIVLKDSVPVTATPVKRGGGSVLYLVLLLLVGAGAAAYVFLTHR
jgi:hypothetical protein